MRQSYQYLSKQYLVVNELSPSDIEYYNSVSKIIENVKWK